MKSLIPVLLVLALAGCGGGETASQSPSAGASDTGAATAGDPFGVQGGAGAAVDPAADAATIVSQLRTHQASMRGALDGAQLTPVHDLSEKMEALIDALPDRSGLEGDAVQRLKSAGWEVKATVALLHEAADRGDLGAARQQLPNLDAQMEALVQAASVPKP